MSGQARRAALVTGGGRGIGRAIALALAREGFAVAVNDLAVGRIGKSGAKSLVDVWLPRTGVSFGVPDTGPRRGVQCGVS